MLKRTVLPLAAVVMLTTAAQAGGRYERDYYAPPTPQAAGTVNNFYGPVTVYQAPAYDYSGAAPAYSPYASVGAMSGGYTNGYSSAYGSPAYGDYGAPWGQPFAGGVGYSPYGDYGSYGYAATPVYGARMDPWNGYNAAPGNGYW